MLYCLLPHLTLHDVYITFGADIYTVMYPLLPDSGNSLISALFLILDYLLTLK